MNDTASSMKSKNLLPDYFRQYFWDTPFTGRELVDWPQHTIERVGIWAVEGHPLFEGDRWRSSH
jgi:hypothetical protein